MIKRIVTSTLVTAGLFASLGVVQAKESRFQDINHHWGQSVIEKAVTQAYIDGYSDGTFKPDAAVSRAEFIKMLMAAIGQQLTSESGEWYEPYTKAATQSGVHRDMDFTQDMNGEISRLEIVRLITRATNIELRNPAITVEDPALVYSAAKKGLIQGLEGGRIGLSESTTRAQAVMVIDRVLRLKDGGVLPVDKGAIQLTDLSLTGTNFMSVLGQPASRKFPVEYRIGEVGLTIEEITVIDGDDPTTPFASEIQEQNVSGSYAFSFKLSWDLSKLQQDLQVADYFRMDELIPGSVQGSGPEFVTYEDSGITRTKLVVSVDKEQLKEYLLKGGWNYAIGGKEYPLFYEQS
ncbi:S-layer homology domain-containing protein [Paenibacillus sp. FSL H8-0034]|jgi:hypothetical protein|uniref:S-layer homology domain-containing protein n=1 Tax=Paenibacillus sp. FSL H8-0034 TaxID=2954671 RepID=UPI0030F583D0